MYNNVREEMVNYYWNVGRMIVEEEQGGNITPEYGRKLYLELAKRLTKKMGKGPIVSLRSGVGVEKVGEGQYKLVP